jgi:AcrR family transcriptional regulator
LFYHKRTSGFRLHYDRTIVPSAVAQLLAPEGDRAPRADAQRNAQRLVDAARAAIDEVGVDVTAHEIARRAGLGIGTFYRRVPSRRELLEAVLVDTVDEIIEVARAAQADADVWRGFCTFAHAFARLRATSCGINEALCGSGRLRIEPSMRRLRAEVRLLVERAQGAGVMRADVAWQDIPFLLGGAVPAGDTIGLRVKRAQWQRNLGVILDGLRSPRGGRAR